MRLVSAQQPLARVHEHLAAGHQVLRIKPRSGGREAFLWDGDLNRLMSTLRLYGIPRAEFYGDEKGPWRVKVWGNVLDRMKVSVELSRPLSKAS